MLNSFYTTLIHDSQVLILEALERLEKDYKGGYREESIASIGRLTSAGILDNDKDDEESWSQILRDLEDVGVSQQQAVSYRDLIVDWLSRLSTKGGSWKSGQVTTSLKLCSKILGQLFLNSNLNNDCIVSTYQR